MNKYVLIKYGNKKFPSGDTMRMYPVKRIELTPEDLQIIWYSITNTRHVFGDRLPNVVNKIKEVLLEND